jgi:carbon-monoxide dehydrogenase medium subunit
VKPAPFKYHDPHTINDLVGLLGSLENTKLLAGGQSLGPMLNFRYLMPDHLLDLNRVKDMSEISIEGSRINVGAMVRQRALEKHKDLQRLCPILREALLQVGHFQTRNRGTIGGSLSHLDPAAELPGIMTLYDAVLEVAGPSGRRKVPMAQWGQGYMTPNLESNEVLVGLSWDVWDAPHGYAFLEFARRRGDFAIAGVACLLALDQSQSVVRSSISLIGIANAPVRVTAAEGLLKGSPVTEQSIEAASAEASKIEANGDLFASGSYRQHLAGVLTKRALKLANERARAAAQPTKSVPA